MGILKNWRTTSVLTGNEPIGHAGRVYKANAAAGAQTHAVVAPSTDGRELYVVKTDSSANTVTLTLTLDGSAQSIVLAYKGDAVKLYDDGTTWTLLGNRPSATSLADTYLPLWKPSTAYAAGQRLVNPTGQTVTANTDHTSGASYDSTKYTAVSGSSGGLSVVDNGNGIATLTATGSSTITDLGNGLGSIAA